VRQALPVLLEFFGSSEFSLWVLVRLLFVVFFEVIEQFMNRFKAWQII
jgi:hypothetical protein